MGGGGDGAADGGDNPAAAATPCTPEAIFQSEINRYSDIPNVSMDVNIRLWWKERMDTYPILQRLARKYLSTSERLFSHGGNIITDTRSCLSDNNAEHLIFLSSNKRFLKKR